jgi:serine/threonine-protein kinase
LLAQKTPAQTVLTEDGATLHFIPGGKITLPENLALTSNAQVPVNPFYMDETQVTNHQYAEFLNQNLSKVEVERRVVRVEDEIWLLLGKVIEGYEPIVFRNGKFKLTNLSYASLPVLRVTALGAGAYARFYNRRLPTYAEWLYALGNDRLRQPKPAPEPAGSPEEMNMEGMHSQMRVQPQSGKPAAKTRPPYLSPVINDPPNRFGIRGLDTHIKEWGLWIFPPTSSDKIMDAEYVVLPAAVLRQPWEAFEEVGFRCVREVYYQGGD